MPMTSAAAAVLFDRADLSRYRHSGTWGYSRGTGGRHGSGNRPAGRAVGRTRACPCGRVHRQSIIYASHTGDLTDDGFDALSFLHTGNGPDQSHSPILEDEMDGRHPGSHWLV